MFSQLKYFLFWQLNIDVYKQTLIFVQININYKYLKNSYAIKLLYNKSSVLLDSGTLELFIIK